MSRNALFLPLILAVCSCLPAGIALGQASGEDRLAQAMKAFEQEMKNATLPVLKKHTAQLEAIKAAARTRNDAATVAAADLEIARLKGMAEAAAPAPLGGGAKNAAAVDLASLGIYFNANNLYYTGDITNVEHKVLPGGNLAVKNTSSIPELFFVAGKSELKGDFEAVVTFRGRPASFAFIRSSRSKDSSFYLDLNNVMPGDDGKWHTGKIRRRSGLLIFEFDERQMTPLNYQGAEPEMAGYVALRLTAGNAIEIRELSLRGAAAGGKGK
jgi:hypothetical protein